MTILEWLFYICITLGLCLLILAVFCFVFWINKKKAGQELIKKKKKMKKHHYAKEKRLVEKSKKKWLIAMIATIVSAFLLLGIAGYGKYYESMNLTSEDSDAIVKGYFLLNDMENELKKAKSGEEDPAKLAKKINYLATSMASYGIKTASTSNTKEGQLIINRYYTYLSELGRNMNNQSAKIKDEPEQIDSFLKDIQKVKNRQKKVFIYYKVDEANLKENK